MAARRTHRVAVGSLFIECNHLGGVITGIDAFERGQLCRGDDVLSMSDGTVGGILAEFRESAADIAPLLAALSCPSGPLTAACYSDLKSELLDRLRSALPVDGVLLALHGSATAENAGDLEGDLLAAVREVVGAEIPIVATLDLHAHVSDRMVQAANALVAWETYPHRDAFTTGRRGARMLLGTLGGEFRPTMALSKAPVVVGGVLGGTEGDTPFADVMRLAKSFEERPEVLSTSALMVHPYLDLPDLGGGGIVITNNDFETASELARRIAEYYWTRRFDLEVDVRSPEEAIRQGEEIVGGPVLLAETADCCGGGAAGDSVATLKALLETDCEGMALAPVVDPVAAAACHRAGEGSQVTVKVGHALDPQWGTPVEVTGTVVNATDGRFSYTGGIYAGQTGEMGPSAVIRVGSIHILVTTHATYDWADEQFRSMGLDTAAAKFIVVKNPMNFRVGYAGISKATFILDTPGCTPATVCHVQYENFERPYFPADTDIPGFVPRVVRGPRFRGG